MKHMLVGLIFIGLGIWGIVTWWDVFGLVMRGVVPFVLLVVGLIALLAGTRNNVEEQPQPAKGNGVHHRPSEKKVSEIIDELARSH